MTTTKRPAARRPSRRATIYLDAALHQAPRLKAAETDQSLSDLVNAAVRSSLAEDADDLTAIEARKREPRRSFESFVAKLRSRGDL